MPTIPGTTPGIQGIDAALVHPQCVVCSSSNESGLCLCYQRKSAGLVEAAFACDERYQGYEGRLHGGVIASILDGAMTHCLFGLGRTAVTAELTVRYKQSVALGRPATVRAWVERDLAPLYLVRATVVQDRVVKVVAQAKFMEVGPCQKSV